MAPLKRTPGPTPPAAELPWEDRPDGGSDIVWRSAANPIIRRDALPSSNSIFNSAVVRFGDGFAGVFRVDNRRREMNLHAGFSPDGRSWALDEAPIVWQGMDPDLARFEHRYDPRVVPLEDRYLVTFCNGYHGPTIGLGTTRDFKTFAFVENALLPFNRNGVLFPRKIGGDYLMLSRPSDNGHTPFGDIFLSRSTDLVHWGRHRFVMGTRPGWDSTKVGAGPAPIETPDGWLMIYHGVLTSCNGFVYSFGAALLDLDEPWRVVARGAPYLMSPQRDYECVGDVPNVVFPCAALLDEATGRLAIYYGAADTVTCLAFANLDELVAWVKENSS